MRMRIAQLALLLFLIPVLAGSGNVQAQSPGYTMIEGRIFNSDTGEPLMEAHVFLSGTKIGTITNPAGRFRLTRVPAGNHRLVVSIIGYGRESMQIEASANETLNLSIGLPPVVYQLGEIYAGNLDERWERHLQRFERLFLGESQLADSVRILNPEVLRFDTNFWGRFTAEALAPLQIENRALGYHITYYLSDFYHNGIVTRWDGDPLYRELTPADSAQAAYWEKNRRDTFYGSLRHLLIALVEERAEEDGFVLYNMRRGFRGFSDHDKFRIDGSRLIRPTDDDHLYHLRFSGRLEIVYTRAAEDPRFAHWSGEWNRGRASVRTSHLELNKRPLTTDPDGEISEVYGATQYGYFAFQRLADATPREYRPEDF